VERKAKKVAFKEIEKMKKLGSVKEPKFISEYYRTKNGNHEAWNSKKRGLFEFLQLCYSNLNDHLLRDIGPSIKHIPFDKQLAAMCHTYPEMKPYAENAGVGLHVLYL